MAPVLQSSSYLTEGWFFLRMGLSFLYELKNQEHNNISLRNSLIFTITRWNHFDLPKVGEPSDEEDELELLADRERDEESLLDNDRERDGDGDPLADLSRENFDLVRGLLDTDLDLDLDWDFETDLDHGDLDLDRDADRDLDRERDREELSVLFDQLARRRIRPPPLFPFRSRSLL